MTIRDAVTARKELVETSLEDAEFEARQLAAFCLGKRRLYTFELADEMPGDALKKLQSCIMRRKNHEPLQYIIGEWGVHGTAVHGERKRADSACGHGNDCRSSGKNHCGTKEHNCTRKISFDVCTGSGCIGNFNCQADGVPALLCDISPEAVSVAEKTFN